MLTTSLQNHVLESEDTITAPPPPSSPPPISSEGEVLTDTKVEDVVEDNEDTDDEDVRAELQHLHNMSKLDGSVSILTFSFLCTASCSSIER